MTRGRGEGTWRRLPDGRWELQVSIGVGPDGKRQRPRFRGRIKEEARDAAEEYRRRLRRGDSVLIDRTRLDGYLEAWLAGLIREPTTMRTYRSVLQHVTSRMGSVRLGELRQEHVRAWQREMLEGGHSASLTNYTRRILSAAIQDAIRDDYLSRNVVALVRDVRDVPRRRTPLDAEQALTFLHAVRDTRLGPFYTVALGLGLRKGELRGLLWSDIEGGVMHVERQLRTIGMEHQLRDLKTGASGRRDLPVPTFVQQALTAEQDAQRFNERRAGQRWDTSAPDLVFKTEHGRPLSEWSIREDFRAQLTATGLPMIHFHDLRHSCATLLLALGVEMRVVQVILGHTSMKTTEVYGHILPSLMADAMGRMDGLLGEAK